jgi:Flp pilus assembly protein TadB
VITRQEALRWYRSLALVCAVFAAIFLWHGAIVSGMVVAALATFTGYCAWLLHRPLRPSVLRHGRTRPRHEERSTER